VGIETSSVDGATAFGTTEIDVQVDDMSITTADVTVVFDESDIEEDVTYHSVIELSFEMAKLYTAS